MKKLVFPAVFLMVIAAMVSCKSAQNPSDVYVLDIPCDVPVNIPDSSVERAVRDTLENMGMPEGTTICRAHMAVINKLEINGTNVLYNQAEDLTGLEYCTSLTDLRIYSVRVHDLEPILGLTQLEVLMVNHCAVANFDGLSALTNLTVLTLAHNSFDTQALAAPDDLSELDTLVNLQVLNLSKNKIYDISQLNTLTQLEELYLAECGISDISVVSNYNNLRKLDLTDLDYYDFANNDITDISPVAGLINLEFLALEHNVNLSDLSAVSGLANLDSLTFKNCNVSNIGPVAANVGLGEGDEVTTCGNPLDNAALYTHIPALSDRGVIVSQDVTYVNEMGVTMKSCAGF